MALRVFALRKANTAFAIPSTKKTLSKLAFTDRNKRNP